MSLTHRDTRFVKGMLARGDNQHDIAAYFGVNGGRQSAVEELSLKRFAVDVPQLNTASPPPEVGGVLGERIQNA